MTQPVRVTIGMKPDLVGMVRFASRAAVDAWRFLPNPMALAKKPPLNGDFASYTKLPPPAFCLLPMLELHVELIENVEM
ncbi:hypothetical protein FVEG_14718 [Fusarium verticillioides 7600]|uniref:Uncharacterized protein n=1 Tax=Gibberella moniliformis (strain M3125 / FGSC 7600) TaxID=334819 RepID=W7LN01_GIBM7|nr:hypothetical protein FVEG_14718 [Fusarium verticillioides 7600]EWG36814.1 hypothetical protein FVEG_14718 [Fusarium verticillioides 7600]